MKNQKLIIKRIIRRAINKNLIHNILKHDTRKIKIKSKFNYNIKTISPERQYNNGKNFSEYIDFGRDAKEVIQRRNRIIEKQEKILKRLIIENIYLKEELKVIKMKLK